MLDLRTIENSIQRIQERIQSKAAAGAGVDPRDQDVLDKLNEQKRVILAGKASVGEPAGAASQVKRSRSGTVPAGEPPEDAVRLKDVVAAVGAPEAKSVQPPGGDEEVFLGRPPIPIELSGREIFFEPLPGALRSRSTNVATGVVDPNPEKTKESVPLRHSSSACSFDYKNLAERMTLALGYGEKQAKDQTELRERYKLVLLVLKNCINERETHKAEKPEKFDSNHARAINVTQNLYNYLTLLASQPDIWYLSFKFLESPGSFSFEISFPETENKPIIINDVGKYGGPKRKRRGGRKTHRNKHVRRKTRRITSA